MKIFTILLCIYFTALSIIPCTDTIAREYESTSLAVFEKADNEHSNDDAGDLCSPLCICSCCGLIITFSLAGVQQKVKNPISTLRQQYYYSFNYSFDYNEGMWHPPTTC